MFIAYANVVSMIGFPESIASEVLSHCCSRSTRCMCANTFVGEMTETLSHRLVVWLGTVLLNRVNASSRLHKVQATPNGAA